MICININGSDIINAYMEALGSTASAIRLDKDLSTEDQINILSVALNCMTAINKFIPVNYNKINVLEFENYNGGLAGFYNASLSRINLKNCSSISNKNPVMATNLAHEYGHHVYANILTSGDTTLIKKMDNLVEKMGDTFINKDQEYIKKLIGPNGGCKSSYDETMDYFSSPSEMFARAFSGLVLKDMEATFQRGTCFGYNYTTKELENFEKELKDICKEYTQIVLSSSKEQNPDTNLFKNLSDTEKIIIGKTEHFLFNKEISNKNLDEYNNENLRAEYVLRNKAYMDIQVNSTKKVNEQLSISHNDTFSLEKSFLDMINEFRVMMPDKVFSKEEQLLQNKKNVERELSNQNYNGNLEDLTIKLENINQSLAALNSSGIKKSAHYLEYAELRNKEKSIDDFLNRFDVSSSNAIVSKIENLKLVKYIKDSIIKKFDCKLIDVKKTIENYEKHYRDYEVKRVNPMEFYLCDESSKSTKYYKHNSFVTVKRSENGYYFGIDKNVREHQLIRNELSSNSKEDFYNKKLDETFLYVNNAIDTYRKQNTYMHNKLKPKMLEKIPFYRINEKAIEKESSKEHTLTHNNVLIDNLLKKAEEKEKNKSKSNDLNFGVNKQINDLLLKYSNKENLIYNNINKQKEIEKDVEIGF